MEITVAKICPQETESQEPHWFLSLSMGKFDWTQEVVVILDFDFRECGPIGCSSDPPWGSLSICELLPHLTNFLIRAGWSV